MEPCIQVNTGMSNMQLCSDEENGKECEGEETEQEEENHVYGVTTFIPITQNKVDWS